MSMHRRHQHWAMLTQLSLLHKKAAVRDTVEEVKPWAYLALRTWADRNLSRFLPSPGFKLDHGTDLHNCRGNLSHLPDGKFSWEYRG